MTTTRERLLAATNELFRRQGFNGTSMSEITKVSGSPTGSLYHFFPGGKDDLGAAVLTESGASYRALFELIADAAPDAATAVADFFEGAAVVLEETDYIDPCPIGTVAREVASTNDRLRRAADAVFDSWVEAAAEMFEHDGLARLDAEELATTVVAALEGGFILARTRGDAEQLRIIGRRMTALTAATLSTAIETNTSGA